MFIGHRRYRNFIWARYICRLFFIVFITTFIVQYIFRKLSSASPIKDVDRSVQITTKISIVNPPHVVFSNRYKRESLYINLTQWKQSLCSEKADRRGPHQKVLTYSIFGPESRKFENEKFTWDKHIELLTPLVLEATQLFPDWIIRLYVDFRGSSEAHRQNLFQFSNVDVCDMHHLPVFNSSLLDFLPGRLWRFICIFDPFVDFVLSRDLDSPLIERDLDTIKPWLSPKEEDKFFHIVRDHPQHNTEILAGTWGAAPSRAREKLFNLFYPMLKPRLSIRLDGMGDQYFLTRNVWPHVRSGALVFDSYLCQLYGGQPFPSQRPNPSCFVGCYRPCCNGSNDEISLYTIKIPCPVACRSTDHLDWTYC
ncbi:unnamed protein product [Adineta steineri]|uniref:Uncharacterized protein n=2 Tax=Adineta steineri TaxID=433720 RepID=A0A814BRT8_9BILA|nr:unnamed protein product [Adineta steineri]